MNINDYFQKVLYSNSPNRIENATLNELNKVRQEIAEFIQGEFPMQKERVGNPFNAGSWEKNTAVNVRFDLDLVVPFRFRDKDQGAQNIKREVCNALTEHFDGRNGFTVRNQRVSTGISANRGGKLIEIDVVAGMEPDHDAFMETGFDPNDERKFLILYDREGSRKIKTNVKRQIQKVKGDLQPFHDVIRLLKVWKKKNDQPIGSYAIELMAYKAQKENALRAASPADMLIQILDYGVQKLPNLKLVDLGAGGEWNNFLDDGQKAKLKEEFTRMKKALTHTVPDMDIVRRFFPINPDYPTGPSTQKGPYGASSYA
jgi:hypothetical protein